MYQRDPDRSEDVRDSLVSGADPLREHQGELGVGGPINPPTKLLTPTSGYMYSDDPTRQLGIQLSLHKYGSDCDAVCIKEGKHI